MDRGDLTACIDKYQRAVEAVTAAVFRTLDGAKIYGNAMPRGGCADAVEVACIRPDRFGGVFVEDRLLEI